jgi:pimeloyl-ACP methyl ester carboxylesterase
MSTLPEVQYARNGEVALAYQVIGSGPLDLTFLPGFIGNLDLMWDHPPYARFLRRLASFSRLILMDRRGTGLSDRLSPEDLPPLEVLMDDLHAVLDEVDSERTALFGFSDAGCLCALFAATYPDRTTALVLYDTAAAGSVTEDFSWQWSDETWEAYMTELASSWGTRAYAEKMFPWFNPATAGDEAAIGWWARFMRQAASPNSAVAIEHAEMLLGKLRTDVESAVRAGRVDYEGAGRLLRFYEDGLNGYTYLEG